MVCLPTNSTTSGDHRKPVLDPFPKTSTDSPKRLLKIFASYFTRIERLPSIVLRISRFFPEEDFDRAEREAYSNDNMKVNEFLYRRVDLEDAVSACLLAAKRASTIGFGRYIVSATTPFAPSDLQDLRVDAPLAVRRYVPDFEEEYKRIGWKMVPRVDRVYVNERARNELGWQPRYDFKFLVDRLRASDDIKSPLARLVGSKGYHAERK